MRRLSSVVSTVLPVIASRVGTMFVDAHHFHIRQPVERAAGAEELGRGPAARQGLRRPIRRRGWRPPQVWLAAIALPAKEADSSYGWRRALLRFRGEGPPSNSWIAAASSSSACSRSRSATRAGDSTGVSFAPRAPIARRSCRPAHSWRDIAPGAPFVPFEPIASPPVDLSGNSPSSVGGFSRRARARSPHLPIRPPPRGPG
jgi:hypothetical protein